MQVLALACLFCCVAHVSGVTWNVNFNNNVDGCAEKTERLYWFLEDMLEAQATLHVEPLFSYFAPDAKAVHLMTFAIKDAREWFLNDAGYKPGSQPADEPKNTPSSYVPGTLAFNLDADPVDCNGGTMSISFVYQIGPLFAKLDEIDLGGVLPRGINVYCVNAEYKLTQYEYLVPLEGSTFLP